MADLITVPGAPSKGAVISISSHVARGSVGNRAMVFALETLGFPVWAVPTVTLPWHPGHGPSTRIVPPRQEFAAFLADLSRAPWLGEVRAVISGYHGDADQAEAIGGLVDAVRAINPGALYVCDPVIGDERGLYVPEATAEAINAHLIPRASIATPNRFELDWFAGKTLPDNSAVLRFAEGFQPERLLVTSAHAVMADNTANLLATNSQALLAENRYIEKVPHGTGDLTAALFLAHLLKGRSDEAALMAATASVFEIIARSAKSGADELMLEEEADSLRRPMAMVNLRHLARAGRAKAP